MTIRSLTPAEMLGLNHIPDEPEWKLRAALDPVHVLRAGRYEVALFSGPEEYGTHRSLGSIVVNNEP